MDYETEEQQVEALKNWWAENGRAVIAGVVIGVSAIGGWGLWQNYQESRTVAASDAYSQAMEAADAGNSDQVFALADQLQDSHSGHLYAAYTQLVAARVAVEDNALETAAERLQWVVSNTDHDDVKVIAQVRLARVLGALGQTDEALDTLPSAVSAPFIAIVEEARGDLLVASGAIDAARSAYQSAMDSEFINNREALSMKLNDISEPVATDAENAS